MKIMIACWLAMVALLAWAILTGDVVHKSVFLSAGMIVLTLILLRKILKNPL